MSGSWYLQEWPCLDPRPEDGLGGGDTEETCRELTSWEGHPEPEGGSQEARCGAWTESRKMASQPQKSRPQSEFRGPRPRAPGSTGPDVIRPGAAAAGRTC